MAELIPAAPPPAEQGVEPRLPRRRPPAAAVRAGQPEHSERGAGCRRASRLAGAAAREGQQGEGRRAQLLLRLVLGFGLGSEG